jgi:hypothetical protein
MMSSHEGHGTTTLSMLRRPNDVGRSSFSLAIVALCVLQTIWLAFTAMLVNQLCLFFGTMPPGNLPAHDDDTYPISAVCSNLGGDCP